MGFAVGASNHIPLFFDFFFDVADGDVDRRFLIAVDQREDLGGSRLHFLTRRRIPILSFHCSGDACGERGVEGLGGGLLDGCCGGGGRRSRGLRFGSEGVHLVSDQPVCDGVLVQESSVLPVRRFQTLLPYFLDALLLHFRLLKALLRVLYLLFGRQHLFLRLPLFFFLFFLLFLPRLLLFCLLLFFGLLLFYQFIQALEFGGFFRRHFLESFLFDGLFLESAFGCFIQVLVVGLDGRLGSGGHGRFHPVVDGWIGRQVESGRGWRDFVRGRGVLGRRSRGGGAAPRSGACCARRKCRCRRGKGGADGVGNRRSWWWFGGCVRLFGAAASAFLRRIVLYRCDDRVFSQGHFIVLKPFDFRPQDGDRLLPFFDGVGGRRFELVRQVVQRRDRGELLKRVRSPHIHLFDDAIARPVARRVDGGVDGFDAQYRRFVDDERRIVVHFFSRIGIVFRSLLLRQFCPRLHGLLQICVEGFSFFPHAVELFAFGAVEDRGYGRH